MQIIVGQDDHLPKNEKFCSRLLVLAVCFVVSKPTLFLVFLNIQQAILITWSILHVSVSS